jgi:UrcA family protein
MFRILSAMAAAMLATSASASIGPIVYVDGVPTAHVSYADLNLHSPGDRVRMGHRIRSTAQRLCLDSFMETSASEPFRNDCFVAAVTSGMTQMAEIAGR